MSKLTLIPSLLLILSSGSHVLADPPAPPDRAAVFSKGDRWCAIGDSITHQGQYLQTIYLYYLTRFPGNRFRLFNAGAGGDTAAGTLNLRMETDILVHAPTVATIMLGMNDIWWEHNKLIAPGDFIRDLGLIVDQLKQRHSRVILITSSPYDGTARTQSELDPKREGLQRYAQETRELGIKRGIPVVDFFQTMSEITRREQAVDPAFSLLMPDRVHPGPVGAFVMGYTFLKAVGASALVSKLVIDAGTGRIAEQTNCTAEDLSSDRRLVSFSLLENSLPFPVSAIPGEAGRLVPFTKDLNQEILQIHGLKTGPCELTIDDVPIGEFSASALSEGINLATIAATPQNKQAAALADLSEKRTSIDSEKLRYIAMMEYGQLKKHYEVGDAAHVSDDVKLLIEQPRVSPAEISERFTRLLELKRDQIQFIKEAQAYDDQIWQNNKPTSHRYRIRAR